MQVSFMNLMFVCILIKQETVKKLKYMNTEISNCLKLNYILKEKGLNK